MASINSIQVPVETHIENMDAQTSAVKRLRDKEVSNEVNSNLGSRRKLDSDGVSVTPTTEVSTTPGEDSRVQQNTGLSTKAKEVEEDEGISLIIELGDKAIKDKLHIDRGAFLKLLSRSPFDKCHTGKHQFQVSRERVILNILKEKYTPDFLQIKYLDWEGEKRPINCKLAERTPQFKFGVIKIHPEVNVESIKADLLSNGVNVDEVYRIKKSDGPTYSVRLSFKDNIVPEYVKWGGEELYVHSYFPGVLICNKCSKGGHIAKYCRTNIRDHRCPLCAGTHIKFSCSLYENNDRDINKRKCANCGEAGHGALDKVCTYYMNEKKVIAVMSKFGVPRHEAKKLVKDIDIDIERYRNMEREENQAGISSTRNSVANNQGFYLSNRFDIFNSNLGNQVEENEESSHQNASSQNNNSSQSTQRNLNQVGTNRKYIHILPDNLRKKDDEIFKKSTPKFFKDAFAGSWASKVKGVNKDLVNNNVEEANQAKAVIEKPSKTLRVREVETQTELLGMEMERHNDLFFYKDQSKEKEAESQNTLINLSFILIKMMEIMSSNRDIDHKRDSLASTIEETLKIKIPGFSKNVSENNDNSSRSPILTNNVLGNRRNLNTVQNSLLRTPQQVERINHLGSMLENSPTLQQIENNVLGSRRNLNSERVQNPLERINSERLQNSVERTPQQIRRMANLESMLENSPTLHLGRIINSENLLENSPSGLTQFLDSSNRQNRNNQGSLTNLDEYDEIFAPMSPSKNLTNSGERTTWLLHQS